MSDNLVDIPDNELPQWTKYHRKTICVMDSINDSTVLNLMLDSVKKLRRWFEIIEMNFKKLISFMNRDKQLTDVKGAMLLPDIIIYPFWKTRGIPNDNFLMEFNNSFNPHNTILITFHFEATVEKDYKWFDDDNMKGRHLTIYIPYNKHPRQYIQEKVKTLSDDISMYLFRSTIPVTLSIHSLTERNQTIYAYCWLSTHRNLKVALSNYSGFNLSRKSKPGIPLRLNSEVQDHKVTIGNKHELRPFTIIGDQQVIQLLNLLGLSPGTETEYKRIIIMCHPSRVSWDSNYSKSINGIAINIKHVPMYLYPSDDKSQPEKYKQPPEPLLYGIFGMFYQIQQFILEQYMRDDKMFSFYQLVLGQRIDYNALNIFFSILLAQCDLSLFGEILSGLPPYSFYSGKLPIIGTSAVERIRRSSTSSIHRSKSISDLSSSSSSS